MEKSNHLVNELPERSDRRLAGRDFTLQRHARRVYGRFGGFFFADESDTKKPGIRAPRICLGVTLAVLSLILSVASIISGIVDR
jgi:hypothetical protein